MTWNYRVMIHDDWGGPGESGLVIHEVHYDNDGNVISWTEHSGINEPAGHAVGSESLESLGWVLDKMKEALTRPILNYKDGSEYKG